MKNFFCRKYDLEARLQFYSRPGNTSKCCADENAPKCFKYVKNGIFHHRDHILLKYVLFIQLCDIQRDVEYTKFTRDNQ